MPYPNEHAFRLVSPGKFEADSFRRSNNKYGEGIHAIFGKLKGEDKLTLQAIHFNAEKFTYDEAKAWVKEHGYKPIASEPASEEDKSLRKTIATSTKEFNGTSRFDAGEMTEWHIISTDHPDHLGDVMDFNGMRLPPVGKAVVLLNHDRNLTYGLPVGKALAYEVVVKADGSRELWQKTQYSPHLPNDLGRHTFNARKDGYFSDSSINFLPRKSEERQGGGRLYKEWDLIEAGPVLMGCNWHTGAMEEPPAVKDFWSAIKGITSTLRGRDAEMVLMDEQEPADGIMVYSALAGQSIEVYRKYVMIVTN